MGLPTGPHGVKELVKTRCEGAWRAFPSLQAAREAQGADPSQACCILDGNVLVRQVPTSANSFESYVSIFQRFVEQALRAANTVVVVFDEPKDVSRAKAAEQARRDAQAKKSSIQMSVDLADSFAPTTDNYDFEVATTANPHEVMRSRAARPRLFDTICKYTMTTLMLNPKSAHARKVLVFDGIDARGASRPFDEAREPAMYSNDDRVASLLTRPIGTPIVAEGDLKLTDVESEIQFLRDSGRCFESIELMLISTIDTDSIAIELMHQSAKNAARHSPPLEGQRTPPRTLLCFREAPSRKRKQPQPQPEPSSTCANADEAILAELFGPEVPDPDRVRHGGGAGSGPATFACFDVAALHASVVGQLRAPCGFHRHVTALLAASWALCGSDFVHLKGMRADTVFDTITDLCTDSPGFVHSLRHMEASWEIRRDTDPKTVSLVRDKMVATILQVVEGTRDRLMTMPRMGKSVNSINAVLADDHEAKAALLKAAWVSVYWSGLQLPDEKLTEWGFEEKR